MKKLLFLFLIICNICKANHNFTLKDTTVIHQISFSKSGNPAYDYSREELDKQRFNIIFEEISIKFEAKSTLYNKQTITLKIMDCYKS